MSGVQVFDSKASVIFDDPLGVALIAEYERECANPLLGRTAPTRESYIGFEEMGAGQCFVGEVDGELCGFAFLLTAPLPHYGRKSATVTDVFVARQRRGTGLGRLLMSHIESHAKASGCHGIFYTAFAGSDFARLLFLSENDGYVNTNHVFCKRLN